MKLSVLLDLLILAFAALVLASCATPSVTPEQLSTVTNGSGAAVGCATGTGPWGRGGVVFVNAAQANLITGKVSVNTDCSVAIESTPPPDSAPKWTAAPPQK